MKFNPNPHFKEIAISLKTETFSKSVSVFTYLLNALYFNDRVFLFPKLYRKFFFEKKVF